MGSCALFVRQASEDGDGVAPAAATAAAGAAATPQVVKKVTTVTKFVTKSLQTYSNGIDMEVDLASERCNITNRTGRELALGGWVLESDVGTQVRRGLCRRPRRAL